jgi:hypothetical protein
LIEDEDEEILNELTKIIPCLLEYIGGKPHSILLFKLIEILLNLEEQSVKNEVSLLFNKGNQIFQNLTQFDSSS